MKELILPANLKLNLLETEISYNKISVTPELARELLKGNNCNRTVRVAIVEIYAAAMREGKWHADTSECIKIAYNMRILDGQHRLEAVIMANVAVPMYIAYNVPETAALNIDTGVRRNSKDIFALHGINNSGIVSATIRKYLLYTVADSICHLSANKGKVTTDMMLEEYKSKPEYWQDMIEIVNKFHKKIKNIEKPLLGAWYLLARNKSIIDANTFFNQLCEGVGFASIKDPIYVYREYIKNIDKGAFDFPYEFAIFAKAWKYFREKKQISTLRFSKNEEYPKII